MHQRIMFDWTLLKKVATPYVRLCLTCTSMPSPYPRPLPPSRFVLLTTQLPPFTTSLPHTPKIVPSSTANTLSQTPKEPSAVAPVHSVVERIAQDRGIWSSYIYPRSILLSSVSVRDRHCEALHFSPSSGFLSDRETHLRTGPRLISASVLYCNADIGISRRTVGLRRIDSCLAALIRRWQQIAYIVPVHEIARSTVKQQINTPAELF